MRCIMNVYHRRAHSAWENAIDEKANRRNSWYASLPSIINDEISNGQKGPAFTVSSGSASLAIDDMGTLD